MNLEQKLMTEIILKKQSVNKLVQVMTSKKNPMNDDKDGRGQSRKMLKVMIQFIWPLYGHALVDMHFLSVTHPLTINV